MLPIVEIKDLTVSYDARPVLWDIDLSFQSGKLWAIVGPNGAGKSTLIKTVLNLIEPVTGTINFSGKPYESVQKEIAYVPQRNSVDWNFPTTVYDVVLMGRYGHVGWFHKLKATDHDIAYQACVQVGIEHLMDRQISQLSGGQQQRVFLARALAQQAILYVMDEPFAGVDIKTERQIVQLFKQLKDDHKTVIVVHHDLDTVAQYFDGVILLNRHVIAYGNIDEVFTTENIQKTYQNA